MSTLNQAVSRESNLDHILNEILELTFLINFTVKRLFS